MSPALHMFTPVSAPSCAILGVGGTYSMSDANDGERFDPTRLVGRATVALLALAGATLVLLPSTGFGWESFQGGWAIRPVLVIANLTALLGVGIAFAIAWAPMAHRAAPLLGAAFGAGAMGWGLRSADAALGFDGLFADALRFAQHGTWVLAAAMISAFCTHFPRTVTRADHDEANRRINAGQFGSGLSAREDPFTMMDAPFAAWDRWIERRLGTSFQQRMRALGQRWGLQSGGEAEPEWARRMNRALEPWLFRDAWLVVLGFVPVLAVLIAFAPRHEVAAFSAPLTLGLMSCFALRFTTWDGAAEDRRRVLWIAAGMVGAFMVAQLGFWSFLICALIGYQYLGIGVFILVAPLAALILVLGFAIAIFGGGALDPKLAIKRTLITGIVATLLTFMFALVEASVAMLLADQVGIPTSAAPAVASAAVAVALGPMWKKVSVWVGGKLGVAAPNGGHTT